MFRAFPCESLGKKSLFVSFRHALGQVVFFQVFQAKNVIALAQEVRDVLLQVRRQDSWDPFRYPFADLLLLAVVIVIATAAVGNNTPHCTGVGQGKEVKVLESQVNMTNAQGRT